VSIHSQKRWVRAGFFALLLVTVGTFDFHLKWIDAWRESRSGLSAAVAAALLPGALFFFSFTLAVTTFFEIEDAEHLRNTAHGRALRLLCWAPVLLYVVIMPPVHYGRIPPDTAFFVGQVLGALFAVSIAAVSKALSYP
jgi:hypothetical protein